MTARGHVPATGDLELTLVPEPTARPDDDLQVAPLASPPTTRFKTVEEERREQQTAAKQAEAEENFSKWIFVAALATVLVVIAGVVWYLNKPLTADELYERITTRAANAKPEDLANLAPLTDDYLDRFPEGESTRRSTRSETIELDRLEKRAP